MTRAAHQTEELARPLRERGADVILVPVIGIAPPVSPEPLREGAKRVDEYDWIVFTSANAVHAFAAELPHSPARCKARVAAVGSATRNAAEQRGFSVTVVPERYVAESLVEALAVQNLNGCRILIPCAAVTRDVVAVELCKRGAQVNVVEAYRNVVPLEAGEQASAVFREPYPDWVTFASSSAVDNLVQLIGPEPLRRVKIATIGPITSDSVRKHGLIVAAEANVHSVDGIVKAIYEDTKTRNT